MAIKLIIASAEKGTLSQELLCEQSLITFGRSKSCTVELDHEQMSRRHFIIRFIEGSYVIVDEGSQAGTILDGQALDPKNCYSLGTSHQIILPGFKISIENDGQAPRQERTTVMARKLMGKILDDANNDDEQIPRLADLDGRYIFYFQDAKSSFVLGSLARLDFVVADDNLVAKEHVSFIRDISGIRVIPICTTHTWINHREICEPEILNHKDLLTIGATEFIYYEYQDDQPFKNESRPQEFQAMASKEDMVVPVGTVCASTQVASSWLNSCDRVFWGIFTLTALGASWVIIRILISKQ